MPQTRIEKLFFMFLTVLLSVLAFTVYNTAISLGSMSNRVFPLAMRELPLEFSIAFLLEVLFFNKLADRLAFRFVDPRTENPFVIILAITAMTICLMCPTMSLAATIIYNGIDPQFVSNWLQKLCHNFPFAFFTQIFFIGPIVRLAFRSLFRKNAAPEQG